MDKVKREILKEFRKKWVKKYKLYVEKGNYFESDEWKNIEQFLSKALDTIEKETKEKMAEEIQRLKMKKIRTFMKAHKDTKGVDLVDIYFADEVDSFLKATDIYLKVNK